MAVPVVNIAFSRDASGQYTFSKVTPGYTFISSDRLIDEPLMEALEAHIYPLVLKPCGYDFMSDSYKFYISNCHLP